MSPSVRKSPEVIKCTDDRIIISSQRDRTLDESDWDDKGYAPTNRLPSFPNTIEINVST